jgi:hypothetical protein
MSFPDRVMYDSSQFQSMDNYEKYSEVTSQIESIKFVVAQNGLLQTEDAERTLYTIGKIEEIQSKSILISMIQGIAIILLAIAFAIICII